MNKKYVLLGSIGMGLVIIIAVVLYTVTKQSAPSAPQQANYQSATAPSPIPTASFTIKGQMPTLAANLTPSEIAKDFYSWYISYPNNVLTTGAYKTSPYLTDGFKKTIGGFVRSSTDTRFDPVFCSVNKTKDILVNQPMYTQGNTQARVQITKNENTDNPTALYNVDLLHTDTGWKIDDIMCIPQS